MSVSVPVSVFGAVAVSISMLESLLESVLVFGLCLCLRARLFTMKISLMIRILRQISCLDWDEGADEAQGSTAERQ